MTFEHNIFVLIVTDTLSLYSLIILTPLYKYQSCQIKYLRFIDSPNIFYYTASIASTGRLSEYGIGFA